jgi:hypothetical protein
MVKRQLEGSLVRFLIASSFTFFGSLDSVGWNRKKERRQTRGLRKTFSPSPFLCSKTRL